MKTSAVLAVLLGLASGETQVQLPAPWNLGAISHRSRRFPIGELGFYRNSKYYYQPWASDKTYYAYVVDSGVRISHEEFEGRAENLWTALKTSDGKDDFKDGTGHGTRVAGVIASKRFGVARTARVVSVKVGDNEGGSSIGVIIKGLGQAISDIASKHRHNNAVINLSMATGSSPAMNEMLHRAYHRRDASGQTHAGILTVTSAGNDGVDARTYSPASVREVITVGAIDSSWNVWPSSNFGASVDILAPGVEIISLSNETDDGLLGAEGTSMAAPHVAALALNDMAVFSKTSLQVRRFLLDQTATKRKIKGDLRGAPNLLANNNNDKQESCGPQDHDC